MGTYRKQYATTKHMFSVATNGKHKENTGFPFEHMKQSIGKQVFSCEPLENIRNIILSVGTYGKHNENTSFPWKQLKTL